MKVDCIIGVYNGESYIASAIDSIIGQTYKDINIIIVDDGSTDRTKYIVDRYADHVRYIYKENGGHASACNRGIAESDGELIAFLDSDDLWHERKIEKQVHQFVENPHLDFCTTLLQEFYHPDPNHHVRDELPGYVTTTLMAKRTLFKEKGYFNEKMQHSHVTEWFASMRQNNTMGILLPEVLAYRRIHDRNLSWNNAKQSYDEHLNLIKNILDQRRKKIKKNDA